jgi:hypothetical protein
VTDPHAWKFHWVEELSAPRGELLSEGICTPVYEDGEERIRYLGAAASKWSQAGVRIVDRGKVHEVEVNALVYPYRMALKTVLECFGVEHLLAGVNGFVLHSSYIDVNGKAILFTAPSETGKSTQAELWNQLRDAEIINGDRSVVRWTKDSILAEGLPFAGSSTYCKNRSLPLQAIVYLYQAPVTTIRLLKGCEAFAAIWKGCTMHTWDRKEVEQLSAVVMQVAKQIPVFYMPCTPDESAIEALEKALMEREGKS